MKLSKSLNILIAISAGLLLFLVSSCKKDEISSRELLVFLQPDKNGLATKTQTVPFVHNPLSVEGSRDIEIYAYASRELATDIAVDIMPNPELVPAYNSQYGTSSLVMPENSYRIVNGNRRVIPKDSLRSDPLQIEITAPELLTDPNGYILPLTITGIQTEDRGAAVSSTHATVYIKVTYEFNNVAQTEVPLTGTLMSRAGWSVSVSNITNGAPGTNMLDGNNSTAWRSSNSSSAAKWAIFDMGASRLVRGFQITPNYVSTNENARRMIISTSEDNVDWVIQGVWNGTGPVAGSNAANPDLKGVNFIAPVQARYYRLEITARVSGNRAGFAEVNAFD